MQMSRNATLSLEHGSLTKYAKQETLHYAKCMRIGHNSDAFAMRGNGMQRGFSAINIFLKNGDFLFKPSWILNSY